MNGEKGESKIKKLRKNLDYYLKIFKEVHGDTYDYSLSVYKGFHERIEIICKEHGVFEQLISNHTKGKGCYKCGKIKQGKERRLTQEEFIDKAKKLHNNFYNYDKAEYITANKKVVITCPIHGEFKQTANTHLSGHGCLECGFERTIDSKRSNRDIFIIDSNKIHNNTYCYDKVRYFNNSTKVIILCPLHGEFLQAPGSHLQGKGCPTCGRDKCDQSRKIKFDDLIERVRKVHDNEFEYVKDSFSGRSSDIEIVCKTHGVFKQNVSNHLAGQKCPKCADEYRKHHPLGWSYSMWEKTAENSKNFDSFKVYLIKCWDENEKFYKIGRTFKTIRKRFKCRTQMPYNWEIVSVISSDNAREICEKEQLFKNCNKDFTYVPFKSFGGQYECFSDINLACLEHTKHIEEQWKKNGVEV